MSDTVQLAFMKSLAVWDDFEIYTDTIGLVVTLQLAKIEVRDFYSCNDMFQQTSVTKHIVGWERELTTFSLKDKNDLDFFFQFSFVKTGSKEAIEPWQPLGLANTLAVFK